MSTKTQGAISVSGLRKSYDHVVLDGVSLDIPAGSVFALLGPNGAGKTTTVNILTTLIPADAGEIVEAGHDLVREPDAVRADEVRPSSSRSAHTATTERQSQGCWSHSWDLCG